MTGFEDAAYRAGFWRGAFAAAVFIGVVLLLTSCGGDCAVISPAHVQCPAEPASAAR